MKTILNTILKNLYLEQILYNSFLIFIARLSWDEDVDNEDFEELEDLISTEETVSISNTNL